MSKIKQGQTRYKAIVYEPGKIEGYDNEYVACVFRCYVTKVVNNAVYYTTENGSYIASYKFFNKLYKTYRKAHKSALLELEAKTK